MKSAQRLNLASRPFVNRRPLRRLAVLLWVVVAALTALNGYLYYQHFSGSRLTGEQQRDLRQRIAEEERRLQELEAELAGLEVAQTNRQARDLNLLIVERAFSWSRLFDRLAEAMPRDVRLATLQPNFAERRGARRRFGGDGEETVVLEIRGAARTDAALLEFVDRLFEHDSFLAPNLLSESRDESGRYDFALTVVYHPSAAGEEAPGDGGAEPSPQASDPDGDEPAAEAAADSATAGEE